MKTIEPIVDYHDKIVYYDHCGKVLGEDRILNSFHPHSYHSIVGMKDRTILFKGKQYQVTEASINYADVGFGNLHVTHLKLKLII